MVCYRVALSRSRAAIELVESPDVPTSLAMNTVPSFPKPDPVVEEYARLAPHYDRRWSFYIEATTRETIARLPARDGDRILDVGCGTGVLLERLARMYPESLLTGVDPAPEMLAAARGRLPDRVELREGWAERLPCEDASFDLVVSCNMFHYIRRPLAALDEMARVLRDGGKLVITDWCDDYLMCRLCDGWLRLFSRAHFRAYGRRQCLEMLREAGYHEAHVDRYRISWLWGLMTAGTTIRAPRGDGDGAGRRAQGAQGKPEGRTLLFCPP